MPWKPTKNHKKRENTMKTNQEPRNPVKLHWKTMKTSQKPNREAKYNVLNGHYGDISKCDIISTTIISSRFGLWHWSLMKDTLPAAPRWRDFPTSRYFLIPCFCCTFGLSRTDQWVTLSLTRSACMLVSFSACASELACLFLGPRGPLGTPLSVRPFVRGRKKSGSAV